MPRSADVTRQRLQEVSLRLFGENGYDRTTASDIAHAAGVTERTFFRHFADKRDVLFAPRVVFEQPFLDAVASSSDGSTRGLIEAAVLAGAATFADEQRAWSRARQRVLDAEPRLQERELSKLADLAESLTAAFTQRGVEPAIAPIAAEIATAAFRLAFARWIELDDDTSLAEVQQEVFVGFERAWERPSGS